jgi:hypothetical protein
MFFFTLLVTSFQYEPPSGCVASLKAIQILESLWTARHIAEWQPHFEFLMFKHMKEKGEDEKEEPPSSAKQTPAWEANSSSTNQ